MKHRSGRCLLALLFAATAGAAQGAPQPQPPQPDKEVAEKLATLRDIVNDRNVARDGEAREVISVLLKKCDGGLNDKDKAAILKGLESVFYQGKLREADNLQLYKAAAQALGRMGKAAGKVLSDAYKSDRFPNGREWIPLHEELLEQLGRTKDDTAIEQLQKLLGHHEPSIQAAAGKALGNFDDSKDAVRKQIVGTLITRWGELESKATPIDPGNIEAKDARDTIAKISGPWKATLRKLTRQDFAQFRQWQEWHNKNKGRDWK